MESRLRTNQTEKKKAVPYKCALCNISAAERYVTTRVVWVTKLGKKKKRLEKKKQKKTNDALSVSVPYSRCLGFTSGAALNPNLQLEAPDGRPIAFICCIARKEKIPRSTLEKVLVQN